MVPATASSNEVDNSYNLRLTGFRVKTIVWPNKFNICSSSYKKVNRTPRESNKNKVKVKAEALNYYHKSTSFKKKSINMKAN